MNIAVIGASGKLGHKIVLEAKARGHYVKAVIHGDGEANEADETLHKSLFDLNTFDIENIDVIISAFGGGFKADPKINKEALEKLAGLVKGTSKRFISIGGAGMLYVNATHTSRVYQGKDHPDFLRGISENILLGVNELKTTKDVNFTVICPSIFFDYEGKKTSNYKVGLNEEVLYSSKGESRISYKDMAYAMIKEAEEHAFNQKCITICEE